MSLKSILLETSNAPRKCLVVLILLLIALGLNVWDGTKSDLRTDGPMIALKSPAILRQQFDRDTISTRLPAGDSLRVMGIDRSSYGQQWLVQTPKGEVGWVDASDLTGIRQIVTDGSQKGDTVSINAVWSGWYIYHYTYTTPDGKEHKRSTDDFMPVGEEFLDYYYDRDPTSGVCTQAKFEKKVLGRTFEEVKRQFGQPVLVHMNAAGTEAQYLWKAFDPATGQMWRPNVMFDKDSTAVSVNYGRPTKRAAGWLKALPFASSIIDWHLTSVLIRGSRYNLLANPMPEGAQKVWMYCMIPLVLLLYLVWMFGTQTIPTLFMGWLMVIPGAFAYLTDNMLKGAIFVVALASAYIWGIMLLAWGMFPFWLLFVFIVAWYAFSLASSPLCTMPHCRCPRCHHMYSIKFDHDEFQYDEIKKGYDIVKDKLLGSYPEKWKTWTNVTTTTTYTDGSKSTSSHREDEKVHRRDIYIYSYIDFEVTYRLDHYLEYYKCDKCGFTETMPYVETTEIDRKVVGSHTGEEAGETRTSRW